MVESNVYRAGLLVGTCLALLGNSAEAQANPYQQGAMRSPAYIYFDEPRYRQFRQRDIVGPAAPTTRSYRPGPGRSVTRYRDYGAPVTFDSRPSRRTVTDTATVTRTKQGKTTPVETSLPDIIPKGPLHIIVSIDRQTAALYANGTFVASTKVSTGTPTHPTPMGVFSVIQKNRHHVSNLYGAPMPYMQRLTWSGTAMHTGALPGYPASHGCIRLPNEFAQMLWKATKLGARVIVTRDEVKPVEFASPRLPVFTPKVAVLPPAKPVETTGTFVRTAGATTGIVVPASIETPAEAPNEEPAFDPRAAVLEAVASGQEIERRTSPVSIFVSRKDGRLYVRRAMQPLFDLPLTLRNPEQPVGTHVYSAMEMKDGEMRWTAVTIPSGFVHPDGVDPRSSKRKSAKADAPPGPTLPPSNASAALERFDLPPEAVERLGPMLVPGSSLIVSDNGIGSETGSYTDFIVLTR